MVSVTLSGKAATITRESNFLVQVVAGKQAAGAAGDVVLTADSGAVVSKAKQWTYAEEGSIKKVDPVSGAAGCAGCGASSAATGSGAGSGSRKGR